MIYGIDVSSNNEGQTLDATGLSFAVVKVSEGDDYLNPDRFTEAEWAVSHGLALDVYHWVKPHQDPAAQFANFINGLQGMPVWDFYAYDEEDDSVPASDQQWASVVHALLTLGRVHFPSKRAASYCGQFFHFTSLHPIALENFWWDPDYGKNDGSIHPVTNGATPVIHQFTSINGVDRNVVMDEPAYHQLCGVTPTPAPAPTPRREMALTFFSVQDHPVPEARATEYVGFVPFFAHPCKDPAELAVWQFIELAHGATSAEVQVGHLPWAEAQRVPGVFQSPAAAA